MNSWLAFVLGMVLGCNLAVLAMGLLASRPERPGEPDCAQLFAQWAARERGARVEKAGEK